VYIVDSILEKVQVPAEGRIFTLNQIAVGVGQLVEEFDEVIVALFVDGVVVESHNLVTEPSAVVAEPLVSLPRLAVAPSIIAPPR
jgi:hypothetical protein